MCCDKYAILQLGGKIRWADVNRTSGMILQNQLETINNQNKGYYGSSQEGDYCELKDIREIANSYKIPIIEDCAHVWRTENKGRRIPIDSDFACFSYKQLSILILEMEVHFIANLNLDL